VRSRSTNRPVWAQGERGSAPRRSAHMTRRCAVRFEEGSRPPKDGANLHSGRPVRAHELLRKHAVHGSSARAVPERGRPKAKAVEGGHPALPHTRNRRARGKCPCVVVLQKSLERLRAQRSASPIPSGSKACSVHGARGRGLSHKHAPSARARGPAPGEKEATGRSSAILIT